MSKKRKITEKASKKCPPEDLFTFASDDVIPWKLESIRLLTDDSSENAECRSFSFLGHKK